MKWIILILSSFFVGVFTAIPVGATQIEMSVRVIEGHLKSAFMLIAGAVFSDLIYGFISLGSISHFLMDRKTKAFFYFIGSALLLVLGILTIIYSNKSKYVYNRKLFFGSKSSFLVGFLIDTSNPSMLLWWSFCFEFLKNIGVVIDKGSLTKIAFVVSGSIGIGSYLSVLAMFLQRRGKFFAEEYEIAINKTAGALLILFSIFFLFKAFELEYL